MSLRQSTMMILSNNTMNDDELQGADVIKVLKKKQTKRTIEDLKIIAASLEKTSLINKLKSEKINNESLYRLLIQLSTFIKLEEFSPKQYVFFQDDIGDKFYVIFEGEVDVLKDERFNESMDFYEYISYLVNLKNDGESQLVEKILKLNSTIFGISLKDFSSLEKLDFFLNYKKKLENWKITLNEGEQIPQILKKKILEVKEDITSYIQANQTNFFIYSKKTFIGSRKTISNIPEIHFELENVYEQRESSTPAKNINQTQLNIVETEGNESVDLGVKKEQTKLEDKLIPDNSNIKFKKVSFIANDLEFKYQNSNSK
jgi:hypothetical protein